MTKPKPPKKKTRRPRFTQRYAAAFEKLAGDRAITITAYEHEVRELQMKLALVQQKLATSQSDAGAVLATLARAREDAEDLRQKVVAEERECDFWIDEAERFRNQVVELLRERAARARPGEES